MHLEPHAGYVMLLESHGYSILQARKAYQKHVLTATMTGTRTVIPQMQGNG